MSLKIAHYNSPIVEESLVGIALFDRTYKVVSWNQQCADIFNISSNKAINSHIMDIISSDASLQGDTDHLKRCLDGETLMVKRSFRQRLDGLWLYLDLKFVPRKDENDKIISGILFVSNQSEIHQKSIFLSEIQSVAEVAGWYYLPKERLLMVLEGSEVILGKHSLQWKTMNDFYNFFEDAARIKLQNAMEDAIQSGTNYRSELQSREAKPRSFRVVWKCESIAGQVTRIYGVVQDITQETRNQELISNQERQIVARSRLAAIGELAAGVAHEINNPLAIATAAIDIIKSRLKIDTTSPAPNEIPYFIRKVEDAQNRISNIVNSFLGFSRHDPIEAIEVDINAIIQATIDFYGEQLKKADIGLRYEPHSSPLAVKGRFNEIEQVLLNIIKNARDFLISEQVEDPYIRIDTLIVGDAVVQIRISNNGPKIKDSVADRIFDPFFTTKEVGKGTGLGMSVSNRIIEEHQGYLYIDRNRNQTCFVIEFPCYAETSTPKQTA